MVQKDLIKPERNTPQLPDGQLVWIPPGFMLTTESNQQPEQESHLWDYIWMIWRKRWLVLIVFMVAVGLAALKNYRAIPIYQATAQLRIESEAPKVISFQGEEMSVAANRGSEFVSTQLQVLHGRQLAQQVMGKLGYLKDAATPPSTDTASKPQSDLVSAWQELKSNIGLSKSAPPSQQRKKISDSEAKELALQMRINIFLGNLSVTPVNETEIIKVGYTSTDPEQCATVANALCDEYIKWTYDSKYESFSYAREWLKTKLDEMKAKLEQSENDLIKLTGGKDFTAGPNGQIPEQLETYRQRIVETQRELFQKQFELQRYTSGKNLMALRALNDPQLTKLLDMYSTDEIQYQKLTTQLGNNSSQVKELRGEMTGIEKQLQEAFTQAKKTAQFNYDQVKANLDYLQKMYDSEKDRVTGIQKNLIQYNILKREVDVNRELYNSLLQRWKEVGVSSGVKASYASVIERALPPMAPTFPNKPRTLMIGAMMGLFLGVGLIFFLDYMDTSVKDPEELERITRLSILGYVAHCQYKRVKGERLSMELMTHFRPRSEFAESIRSIRTSIQYSRAGGAPRVILVTSCLPNEGKTTIATNLAIALANRNKRVLLVDADLKKPSLNKLFNVDRKLGLSEVLTGKFDGSNLPETEISNLFVMPSGSRPPNPVELLDSDVMRNFLEKAANEYDHVIIDSAPSLNMADSPVLAPYVDGIILVVQPGKTPREAVRRVREHLMEVQGNILGLVVNNPLKGTDHRYGSRYGYGYGYGNGTKYGYGFDQGNGRYRSDQETTANGANDPGKTVVDIPVASRQIESKREEL